MSCPKCGGLVIDDFGDQRCLTCGCRPQADPVRDPDPDESIELNASGRLGVNRLKRSADDVMKLVMSEVRAHRGKPKEDDDMARETSATCTWPSGCEEKPAEDSRYCAHHRDIKKRSNENQKRKREGLPPLPPVGTTGRTRAAAAQPPTPKSAARPSATTGPIETPGATWREWREGILAQMDQAISQLEAQLTKTKAARAAVEGL